MDYSEMYHRLDGQSDAFLLKWSDKPGLILPQDTLVAIYINYHIFAEC